MNNSKLFLVIYVIAAILVLTAELMSLTTLNLFSKPVLMISLIGWFASSTSRAAHPAYFLIAWALFFAWLGDVFLMFQTSQPTFFIFGLGAFLISHLFYIVINRKLRIDQNADSSNKPRLARYNFFLLLICLSLITVLQPNLSEMVVPVVIYAFTITFMTISAMHRYGKTNNSSFWMVMIGALLFMISDSTIALNKFMEPIPYARIIIMITYITAQFMIVKGFVNHVKE